MFNPLQSGMASGWFRAMMAMAIVCLAVSFGQAQAQQSDASAALTLRGSHTGPQTKPTPLSAYTFVSNADATLNLKSEVQRLSQVNATGSAAIVNAASISYYSYLVSGLAQGGNIADVIQASSNELNNIVNSYSPTPGLTAAALRQQALALVTL